MKKLISTSLILYSILFITLILQFNAPKVQLSYTYSIPTVGNSWVSNTNNKRNHVISKHGIQNWKNEKTKIKTFFKVENSGNIDIALLAKVKSGESTIQLQFADKIKTCTFNNTEFDTIYIGTFHIQNPGYQFLEMQGISKNSKTFADVTDILIGGEATSGKVYYARDDFYWGRRGPSVHLNYKIPDESGDILYFYNEITIPEGEDIIGSYFMANGFGEGYFGIQVNSPKERRILFSVWSPYQTNNPKEIPQDQRIIQLKKGRDVHGGKFGGEGSGGQSYKKYMWKAGTTYGFLLKGEPTENNSTDYTAYFFAPEIGEWELMASFRRPQTNTYLKRLHSFLENFIPQMGQYSRKGVYTNQWIYDTKGNWHELTEAQFTADATARKESRMDYAGGAEGESFFMKNCGFFNDRSEIETIYQRKASKKQPKIDFTKLP